MSKQTTIIIALILLLMFLSGCKGLNPFGPGKNDPVILTQENVCLDNNGLDIRYMDNMPPKRIYENDKFYISIALMNNGCYDIKKGKLTVSVDTDSMVLEDSSPVVVWNSNVELMVT